jgi:hypothetical protein
MKKHNKKRNTAFLYEVLIKEYTRAIVNSDSIQNEVKAILKEFFNKKEILFQELQIYNELLESVGMSKNNCHRLMVEVKKDFLSLNRKEVFNAQTKLLKRMNESFSNKVFATFLSNYRNIATVGQYLNSEKLAAKQRVILENKTFDLLTSQEPQVKPIQHIDNLTFKTFIDKFNETYNNTLRTEQKTLLNYYITSFANNGIELKMFLNEEIGRLRKDIGKNLTESVYKSKFDKILIKLDNYSKHPINEDMIREVFYIQDLVHEVNKNGS